MVSSTDALIQNITRLSFLTLCLLLMGVHCITHTASPPVGTAHERQATAWQNLEKWVVDEHGGMVSRWFRVSLIGPLSALDDMHTSCHVSVCKHYVPQYCCNKAHTHVRAL